MMGKRLYKTYVNLTNIIVRLSDGTEEGKKDAVLVNSHVDSTLPSPGAADDAMPVGVMLENLRVLIHTPNWQPKHAVIFCKCNRGHPRIERRCDGIVQCLTTRKSLSKMGHTCFRPSTL